MALCTNTHAHTHTNAHIQQQKKEKEKRNETYISIIYLLLTARVLFFLLFIIFGEHLLLHFKFSQ